MDLKSWAVNAGTIHMNPIAQSVTQIAIMDRIVHFWHYKTYLMATKSFKEKAPVFHFTQAKDLVYTTTLPV